jgi:hypothetical protein
LERPPKGGETTIQAYVPGVDRIQSTKATTPMLKAKGNTGIFEKTSSR